jgi:hypothetical protein
MYQMRFLYEIISLIRVSILSQTQLLLTISTTSLRSLLKTFKARFKREGTSPAKPLEDDSSPILSNVTTIVSPKIRGKYATDKVQICKLEELDCRLTRYAPSRLAPSD